MPHQISRGNWQRWIISLILVLGIFIAPRQVPSVQAAEGPRASEEEAISGLHQPETISASVFHTCGIKSDGSVMCWGQNDYGMSTPPDGVFSQISASNIHACGRKTDGTLACWGYDNGTGLATPPEGLFRQVSVNSFYDCAIKNDGTIFCWGYGGDDYQWLDSPPPGIFTQISAGYAHACAVRSDGVAVCWGHNDHGETAAPNGSFVQVSAGGYHSCGIRSDGAAVCWGSNEYGGQSTPPTGRFVQISAGYGHTCGIQTDGVLLCWGAVGYRPDVTIVPATLPDGSLGGWYSQSLIASGGTAPYSYTLISGSLPGGLTLGLDGLLSGIPDSKGVYTFTVQAVDSSFPIGSRKEYTLVVENIAPVAYSQALNTVEDTSLPITLTALDAEGDPLTWSVDAPAHGELSGIAPEITYSPAPDYFGSDSFTFYVNDGLIDSAVATVSITITPVNDSPVALDDAGVGYFTDEDTVFTTGDVKANDRDPEGDPFLITGIDTSMTSGQAAIPNTTGTPLDSSFDEDGKATTDFGGYDQAYGVAIQADGKIVAVGFSNSDFAVARYNMDGKLDPRFDGDGRLISNLGQLEKGKAVILQGDGKILVTGSYFYWGGDDFVLARYNQDGTPDISFGKDGMVLTNLGGHDFAQALALQMDGKVVVAGYSQRQSNLYDLAITRYNTDGALDTSFNGNGKVITDFGESEYGYAVKVQADGKIVVVGSSNGNFILVRYNTDGTLDLGFDGDGRLTTDFGSVEDAFALGIQADGKIVVAGSSNGNFALARYDSAGKLDPGFDGDGKLTIDFGGSDYGKAIVLQADGKIVVAGYSNGSFALTRVNADGSLDLSLDSDGKLFTSFPNPSFAQAVALQADGKIVVAGYSNDNFVLARYNPDGVLAFVYNPNGQFEYLGNGELATDTFTYTVSDGALDATATVRITIAGVNDAPQTFGQSLSMIEDVPLMFTLAALDKDGDGLNWSVVQPPKHGTLSGIAPNLIYTPELNFYNVDSFTYKVNDGVADSNLATVTIVVNAVQDYPMPGDDSGVEFITDENTSIVTGNVMFNDLDPDYEPVKITGFDKTGLRGQVVHNTLPGGILDPNFSGDGKVLAELDCNSYIYGVVEQPDGKIVTGMQCGYDLGVARYNVDGTPDSSFDWDGVTITDMDTNAFIRDVELQADGKLIILGHDNADFLLVRYNPDGSIDTGFDGDGKVRIDIPNSVNAYASEMALQIDGKIIVAGYLKVDTYDYRIVLVRFDSNGQLDAGFDGDGIVITKLDGISKIYSLALQEDGKIVVAGENYFNSKYNFLTLRYNPNGTLDTSFDGDGWKITSFGSPDHGKAVALQADGKIVVAGYSWGTKQDCSIVRYNTDGTLDTTFDFDGMLEIQYGLDCQVTALELQRDGRILVAGIDNIVGDYGFVLMRLNPNGSLDTSFDGDGKVNTTIGTGDFADDIIVQKDGNILMGGYGMGQDNRYHGEMARYTPGGEVFTYDPNGQFESLCEGQVATDTFTYTVSDGALSATATVKITILGVHDDPQAMDDAYSTDEDIPLVIAAPGALANDMEADADSVHSALQSGPLHGKAVLIDDGAFTYIPDEDFNGIDSFTYFMVVFPAKSWVDVAIVTITVNQVNDAPTTSGIVDHEWLARGWHSYDLYTAFTDVDGDSLFYSATVNGSPLPAWLSIDSVVGTLSGAPGNENVGVYTVVVTAADGHGETVAAPFNLTVALNPFLTFFPLIGN